MPNEGLVWFGADYMLLMFGPFASFYWTSKTIILSIGEQTQILLKFVHLTLFVNGVYLDLVVIYF